MNSKNNITLKTISEVGLIAAIYVTVSLALAPFSFAATQIRVAEALTIMPVFKKRYVYAVTLGCFLANLIGFCMGQTIILDSFLGTFATFISAMFTYQLRNIRIKDLPLLSTLPPVVINAIIVGSEITFMVKGKVFDKLFWFNAFSVAFGEFISCCIIGMVLFIFMKKIMIVKKDW